MSMNVLLIVVVVLKYVLCIEIDVVKEARNSNEGTNRFKLSLLKKKII